METLTFNNNFRQIFRNIYLLWILIWLGWEAGGQVTILSILTWLTAPISQPSWNTLLSDPLLIVLMSYVLVTFFVWGRGVFCGWLCPVSYTHLTLPTSG